MCIRDSPITEHDGSRPEKVDKNLSGIGLVALYGGVNQQLTTPTIVSEEIYSYNF